MNFRVIFPLEVQFTLELEATSPQEAATMIYETIESKGAIQFEVYPLHDNGAPHDHPYVIVKGQQRNDMRGGLWQRALRRLYESHERAAKLAAKICPYPPPDAKTR